MAGVRLAELTWEEAVTAYQTYSVALLPIGGGSKAHGSHLPLSTDLLIAQELADRVVQAAPILLLPALTYAYYPAFIDWVGSVSIESQHFADFVGDIIRSVHRHGIRKFVLLDWGLSTHPVLDTLSRNLHQELGVLVAVTLVRGLGSEVIPSILEQESGGHADEMETSAVLAIRPDLVQMDKAVKEIRTSLPGSVGANGITKFNIGGKMKTPHGVNGDATLATVEKGEQILAAKAKDIISFVEQFDKLVLS